MSVVDTLTKQDVIKVRCCAVMDNVLFIVCCSLLKWC